MNKTIWILAFMIVFGNFSSKAQNEYVFSLDEAIQYALENSHDIKNAKTDIEIARKKVKETTAIGLPQINAKISNTNYIDIPTQLMPDFISPAIFAVNEDYFGLTPTTPQGESQYFPVQFGTKHNISADLSVAQLIFNGSYIVGLQAARTYLEQSKVQFEKSKINTRETITKAYVLVLVTQKNKSILDSTLTGLKEMAFETREIFKQGFIDDINVDQLDLMVSDLGANMLYINSQIEVTQSYLKLSMGMPLNDKLILADKIEDLIPGFKEASLLLQEFNITHNIDFRVMSNQKDLLKLALKNEQATYLPSISGFFNAQTNAMRDTYNFFNGDEKWYPSTVWGIQMDIPIFSSGSRNSKVKQAKLNLQKLMEADRQLKKGLTIEEKNAKSIFKNSLMVHDNKIQSHQIAKKIYYKTSVKYKEGMTSSLELLQAYNQYLSSEADYINSIVELVNAKMKLEKLFAK